MIEQPLIASFGDRLMFLPEETEFSAKGIVSRTLLRTDGLRVVLFAFAEGQELTEHTTTQHAIIQILSGECEFQVAGKDHHLEVGHLLYMPPNCPHAVKASKPFSMLLTVSSSALPKTI